LGNQIISVNFWLVGEWTLPVAEGRKGRSLVKSAGVARQEKDLL